MASLAAIRAGIAGGLSAVSGVPKLTVSAYVPVDPTPPVIWIRPDSGTAVEYHQAMQNGLQTWPMLVQAYAGALSSQAAQEQLDLLVSSTGGTSVKAALELDRTLGGACSDLKVVECRGYEPPYTRPDGATVIGAEWLVEVYTQN